MGLGRGLIDVFDPFWDWLPTVATHQFYCATDSGFWVYKTPEQWKAQNPGVMETLVKNKNAPSTHDGDDNNYTDTDFLNQRFNLASKKMAHSYSTDGEGFKRSWIARPTKYWRGMWISLLVTEILVESLLSGSGFKEDTVSAGIVIKVILAI